MADELEQLREEVKRLREKKAMLEEIRRLKLEKVRAKIQNIGPNFAAAHPYISGALGYLGRGALQVGRNAAANSNSFVQRPVINTNANQKQSGFKEAYGAHKIVKPAKLKKFVAKSKKKRDDTYFKNLSEAYA